MFSQCLMPSLYSNRRAIVLGYVLKLLQYFFRLCEGLYVKENSKDCSGDVNPKHPLKSNRLQIQSLNLIVSNLHSTTGDSTSRRLHRHGESRLATTFCSSSSSVFSESLFRCSWICNLLTCKIRRWRRNFGVTRVTVILRMKSVILNRMMLMRGKKMLSVPLVLTNILTIAIVIAKMETCISVSLSLRKTSGLRSCLQL
ncbi:hypothetical protein L6452_02443 [Arctium lappa]|uniref:Uncharacterized protein n=1 Tax=Arctium lappa TaxID=4217 RepID=A0ACB9FKY5_ARCLA|nr:hypothetical protein L6452_02443 [Arctium lappa]